MNCPLTTNPSIDTFVDDICKILSVLDSAVSLKHTDIAIKMVDNLKVKWKLHPKDISMASIHDKIRQKRDALVNVQGEI